MSLCVRPQWDYMIFGCRCGSLLVDFEVFTPEEDEDDSVIMDKMSEAVKSNSIDGFSVSADSYSFTRMPSRLRKKCIIVSLSLLAIPPQADFVLLQAKVFLVQMFLTECLVEC